MSVLLLIDQALIDFGVSIYAAVAQKRPVRALLVHPAPIDFGDHDLFPVDGTLCDDFAVRAANKALSPEFDPVAAGRRFVTDAIRDGDVTAVRDGVTALDRFPGGMLRRAVLLLSRSDASRSPSDKK